MTQPVSLAHYKQLVEADVARVLAEMTAALAQRSVGAMGGPLFASLARADQFAVQTVLGTPEAAGEWAPVLRQTWLRAVQAGAATDAAPARDEDEDEDETTAQVSLRLTLKDEQEVEEEIEVSRLMQQLESQAEATLRDLRPLAAALRADGSVTPESVLLHPQAAAAGLGEAVRQLPCTAPARLACLHVLCGVAAEPLAQAYRRHLKALQSLGVKPAQFRVKLGVSARSVRADDAWEHVSGQVPMDDGQEGIRMPDVLSRLVQQAHLQWAAVSANAGGGEGGSAQWPREFADQLMDQLLYTLGREAQVAPAMSLLLSQLTPAGQRLASREPALWEQHEHPWWLLLDRLMGLCAVLDDAPGAAQDQFAASCRPLVTRFAETDATDTAACQQLLDDVDTLARRQAEGGEGAADEAAAAPEQGPPLDQLLRDQMAQQLRQSQAPASLRRFLLGPWVQVLAQAMHPQAGDPQRARTYTAWVDELLAIVARAEAATDAESSRLLDVAREGLERIGQSESQIESWLFDLTMRLSDSRAEVATDAIEQGWRHEELPTVPIDLPSSGVKAARARRDREAWLRSLRVGDICRVFIESQWRTLQLASVDQKDQIYSLQERSAPEPHRLTRAALERLRAEGLATTVEPGSFIVKAMDTVVDTLGGPRPRGRAAK